MRRPINFKKQFYNADNKFIWILFILWPFYALIVAIKNYQHSFAKNIVWLFIVFYGYSMVIVGDEDSGADAVRYRNRFIEMTGKNMAISEIGASLYNDDESLDIFQSLTLFFVSRLTNNYHFLFATFGLIFGFFYSRNIWFLIERAGFIIKRENILLIITFALIVGFWEINNFRFWTAAHLFVYGTLLYLIEGKKLGLGLALLTSLVHFSFLFAVGLLLAYILIGNRTRIYFYFFLVTLFLMTINIGVINEFLTNHTPSIFHQRINSYADQDYADSMGAALAKNNWYVRLYTVGLGYVILLFILIIYYNGEKFISKHRNLDNLFGFALFFSGMANIANMMPSGGRFVIVGYLIVVPLIFWYVQFAPRERYMKSMITLSIPALTLFCIVAIRVSFDTIGLLTVFGNPIVAPFVNNDLALIDIIKKIL